MTALFDNAAARQAALAMHDRIGPTVPKVAVILGSGLGGLVDEIRDARRVSYDDIPGFAAIHVGGHAGQLVAGTLDDVPVLALAGRFHLYEGHSAQLAGFPVRVAHALGARTLLVSNAAGGINREFTVGDLMMIEDHLNLTGTSPLVGPQHAGDSRFPDMSAPYDIELRALLAREAARLSIPLKSGV